jgi:phosphate transport system substrate-binding protein
MIKKTITAFALGLLFSLPLAADPEKLVIMGSDTLGSKLVLQLKEAYMTLGSDTDFEISAEGSSQAFANLLAGEADIGMSSRDAQEEEANRFLAKGKKLVEHAAGWDMIAVIVNEKKGVRKLTLKEIEGIFTGDIMDWSELGGKPGKISVYTRNTASGTFQIFQRLAMGGRDYSASSQKLAGNEQIASEVAANENGIGYVGLAFIDKKGLRAVKVDGVSPSPKNKGKYPLARKLFFYTAGEPKGSVKKFLDWATKSDAAKEIVAKVGFIPVK